MNRGIAHLSANSHDFPNVGMVVIAAAAGGVQHDVFQPLLLFNVFYFVDHNAHGIAKHVVHLGFQMNALHVSHPVLVFPGCTRLHCCIRRVRVCCVVSNDVQRRIGFDGRCQ